MFDATDIIEAAYRVTAPEQEWLEGVLQAARPGLKGQSAYGYLFDASGAHLRVLRFHSVPRNIPVERAMETMVEGAPREYVERTWLSCPFALASDIEGSTEILERSGAPYRDVMAVNGFDASGFGFWLGTTLPARGRIRPPVAERWRRVAAHLGAAYRLRRRLTDASDATVGAAAILRPDGRVAHAEPSASSNDALHTLREAVLRFGRNRDKAAAAPDARLARWKGMVDAQWSLIDHFMADGQRYVVARENGPSESELERLTQRERQVLACLATGHTSKVVAYELGLADATVRVLVMRAARKLRAKTRAAALERFQELSMRKPGSGQR